MFAYGPAGWARSLVVVVDVIVATWFLAMVVLGALAMAQIDRLAVAADSLAEVAHGETELAAALAPLQAIPYAGDQIASARQQLEQASAATSQNAVATRSSLHELAGIAFVLVMLLALFPVLAFYVPMRVTRHLAARPARPSRPIVT